MSLLSLLRAGGGGWRTEFPIEHLQVLSSTRPTPVPSFCGVRTTRYKYVEYVTGEREFYDLAADPYELQNQVNNSTYASEVAALRAETLYLCSPPPPDWIQVTALSPTSGSPGTSVTLTGLHFTGASSVTFNGMSAPFVVGSDTQLTATVPQTASSGPICVIVGSRTGCGATTFTVTQASGIARRSQVGIALNQSGATLNQLSVPVGPGGIPAGHTVVVAIAASNAITITSVTDSRGNGYSSDFLNVYGGTGKCTTALYSAHLATDLVPGDTISVSVSQGNAWGFVAEDWSGLTAFDQSGVANSNGTLTTSASVTTGGPTTASNEAVFGLICVGASATVTGDPGYPTVTSVKIKNGLTTRVLSLESKIVSATDSQTAMFTLSPARAWSGIIGTFR